jgi:anti-sigma factor RsiW
VKVSGCRRWGAEIGAYLDGELPAEAVATLEAHLPGCEDCGAALATQRGIDRRVAELPRVEPTPQFEARFWARLARAREAPPARGWRARFPGLALAAAGVAALLWLVTPGDLSLPERDWEIVAEAERFELLMDEDLEVLWELEELEAWDGSEEI